MLSGVVPGAQGIGPPLTVPLIRAGEDPISTPVAQDDCALVGELTITETGPEVARSMPFVSRVSQ